MYAFNKSEKELKIYKCVTPEPGTVYESTEMFESYEKYRKTGLEADIRNVLFPLLNKELGMPEGESKIWVSDCSVKYDNAADYRNYEYYSAFVKIGGFGITELSKPFCIFKLPYMDEFGVVKREGKQYAMISELVQADGITFGKGELKVITEGNCYINLKDKAKNPKMTYRGNQLKAVDVLFALARKENIDCKILYEKLVSRDALMLKQDEFKYEYMVNYGGADENCLRYLEALESDAYSLSIVRDSLNDTLSIDRALGKRLAVSIQLSTGEKLNAEDIVTPSMLKAIKYDRINEILVEDIPNMIGWYLAETVHLGIIRRGTEMLECIRERFPNVKGQYMSKDVNLEGEPIEIPAGTQVTKGLLEVIAYNGYRSVCLVEKEGSSKIEEVPFEVSVIGNRCFKKRDLGITDSDEYVYVHEDGTITQPSTSLTAYDLLAMISLYERLSKGKDHEVIAHRDLGLRKKVNLANELFHRAFKIAAPEFARMIKNKLNSVVNSDIATFGNPDKMEAIFFALSNKWWSTLYKKMKIITKIDMDNPVAFYSSFAKINSIIKDKNSVTRDQRGMSMGHYGRLCPYETPSGKTMGVVNNRATGCKIVNGIMKTCYYKVKHLRGKSFIEYKPIWLSVEEEEKFRIAEITSLNIEEKTGTILSRGRVLARIPSADKLEKMTLSYIDVEQVELVNVDPNQIDGLPATTIPFQGANDAARVIFGIGMAKQAKGLLNGEIPIVSTSGFRKIPRKSTYYMICAEYDGEVADVTSGSVTMYYDELGTYKTYEFTPSEFAKTAVIVRTVRVDEGQRVKAGDVLVDSNYTRDGYMVTGVNCLVAYVPKGFNYEDGVYGSERLSRKMTSYGGSIEKEKIPAKFKSSKIEHLNKFSYKYKNGTICRLKHVIGSETGTMNIVSRKLKGFIIQSSIEWDKNSSRERDVRVEAVSFDPLHPGDKLANRHGNKGVTPVIKSNDQMAMFLNGEFVDLCYNPMGVGSRMNIGQVLECNLGLACYVLGIRCESDSFNGATEEDIKLLLSYAWDLANEDDAEVVVTNPVYSALPEGLHDHVLENIDNIKSWKGCFNKDGTAYLYNPEKGKFHETPVLVGINYVYKLVHEAAKKEHARGGFCTEPYIEKLSAPTKGASNRGGQRFGYMELDGLAAYGADALMHEILNERGDNPVARNNLTVRALHQYDDYILDESTSIRRSTEYFVNALEALGVKQDFEGELPNNTREECKKRKVYKRKALLAAVPTHKDENSKPLKLCDMADKISSIK